MPVCRLHKKLLKLSAMFLVLIFRTPPSNGPHPYQGLNLVRKLLLCRLSHCNLCVFRQQGDGFGIDFPSFVAIQITNKLWTIQRESLINYSLFCRKVLCLNIYQSVGIVSSFSSDYMSRQLMLGLFVIRLAWLVSETFELWGMWVELNLGNNGYWFIIFS